eukprot:718358-Rhodomonas_salina.6
MGTSNSTPVDQTENGPYYNQYWRARTRDADWELREALLDGDKQTVCALLGIDSEQPGLFERLATSISKSDRTRQIAALKPLQELVLTSHRCSFQHFCSAKPAPDVDFAAARWNDDRGQTGKCSLMPLLLLTFAARTPPRCQRPAGATSDTCAR